MSAFLQNVISILYATKDFRKIELVAFRDFQDIYNHYNKYITLLLK